MNEAEGRDWIAQRSGERAVTTLEAFVEMVRDESGRQNLIAPSTVPDIWVRHVMDSAQLVPLGVDNGVWLDVGSGAGFPGLVVAILRPQPTILVEPRRRRADFLSRCVAALGLDHVKVRAVKVETLSEPVTVISARAVAPAEKLLQVAAGCATNDTRWLLPRGHLVEAELHALRRHWRGVFHVKQSLTNANSVILIGEGITRR